MSGNINNAFDFDNDKNDEIHQRVKNLLLAEDQPIVDDKFFETVMHTLKYRDLSENIVKY